MVSVKGRELGDGRGMQERADGGAVVKIRIELNGAV